MHFRWQFGVTLWNELVWNYFIILWKIGTFPELKFWLAGGGALTLKLGLASGDWGQTRLDQGKPSSKYLSESEWRLGEQSHSMELWTVEPYAGQADYKEQNCSHTDCHRLPPSLPPVFHVGCWSYHTIGPYHSIQIQTYKISAGQSRARGYHKMSLIHIKDFLRWRCQLCVGVSWMIQHWLYRAELP